MNICIADDTNAPGDELNIAQANKIAKIFLTELAQYGWFITKNTIHLDMVLDCEDISADKLERARIYLLSEFSWYWLPFSNSRRKYKNLVKSYR